MRFWDRNGSKLRVPGGQVTGFWLLVGVVALVISISSTHKASPVQASPPIGTPAVLVGHVTWQGRLAQPNPKQQVAIILQLKSGGKETTFSASTDTSGYFTVTVGAVTDSIYQWRVRDADSPSRRSTYLARSGSTKLQAAAVNKVELGTLKAGDTNGDNVVNMADFVTVRRSFGPCTARGCVDPRADLNGDSTINVTDFNLVKSNFGQAGAPPF